MGLATTGSTGGPHGPGGVHPWLVGQTGLARGREGGPLGLRATRVPAWLAGQAPAPQGWRGTFWLVIQARGSRAVAALDPRPIPPLVWQWVSRVPRARPASQAPIPHNGHRGLVCCQVPIINNAIRMYINRLPVEWRLAVHAFIVHVRDTESGRLMIGTACSGSDLLLKVSQAIATCLQHEFGIELEVVGAFAVEKDFHKQNFLLRNHPATHALYGDVGDISDWLSSVARTLCNQNPLTC